MTTTQTTQANRETIAQTFNTDSLTTHIILQNLGWGFFQSFFANAEKAWKDAHTHEGILQYWKGVNIEFVKQHFEIFASNSFYTSSGWGPLRNGRVNFEYSSGYVKSEIVYNN